MRLDMAPPWFVCDCIAARAMRATLSGACRRLLQANIGGSYHFAPFWDFGSQMIREPLRRAADDIGTECGDALLNIRQRERARKLRVNLADNCRRCSSRRQYAPPCACLESGQRRFSNRPYIR